MPPRVFQKVRRIARPTHHSDGVRRIARRQIHILRLQRSAPRHIDLTSCAIALNRVNSVGKYLTVARRRSNHGLANPIARRRIEAICRYTSRFRRKIF